MMKLSNLLMGGLNFVTMALSVPIIVVGIWLATKQDSECMRFLQQPTIAIGGIILLVSVAGFIGSCCRISWLLWIYLFAMFLLILLLLFFTVFAFIVTNEGVSHGVAGSGFYEYKIQDYSEWLQKKVEDGDNWRNIKSCLHDSYVCLNMINYPNEQSFRKSHLSPLESGCCKPPTSCGFGFENATLWDVVPRNPVVVDDDDDDDDEDGDDSSSRVSVAKDPDCYTWSNHQEQLCFDCKSCRAGLLANIKRDWHKVAMVNTVVLAFLVVVYSVGCCAFYNAKKQGYYNNHGFGRWWP